MGILTSDCRRFDIIVDKCPLANDKFDQILSDILFLIDTSHNISKMHFQQAVKLITNTVEQFNNIGSDGIQVKLCPLNFLNLKRT